MSNLRAHQVAAVSMVQECYRRRVKRVLLVMPTGAGKTHTAAELIRRAIVKGRRVLFLVHRREIVLDTVRRVRAAGIACGVVMAGEAREDASVQVASVQTIAARGNHPTADLVIWDEAHHTAAETYKAIAAKYVDAYHLGLTATPERGDGQGLSDAFDELVAPVTVAELTAEGLLSPCDVVAPAQRLQGAIADNPVDAWIAHAAGRPTVAFFATVAESEGYARDFNRFGIKAEHVDGGTSRRERDAILARFAAGEIDVLCNVFVLTEGWDCPRAKVCLIARGCGSTGTYLQMVGRVLRPDGAGTRALVIDLAGAVNEHGKPDEARLFTLDGIDRKKSGREWIAQCLQCGFTCPGAKRGKACRRCGAEWPAPEAKAISETALVTVGRVPTRDEKDRELTRLLGIARERGYRSGWAGYAFKSKYGHWPRGIK